jgi:hypothetical protein
MIGFKLFEMRLKGQGYDIPRAAQKLSDRGVALRSDGSSE